MNGWMDGRMDWWIDGWILDIYDFSWSGITEEHKLMNAWLYVLFCTFVLTFFMICLCQHLLSSTDPDLFEGLVCTTLLQNCLMLYQFEAPVSHCNITRNRIFQKARIFSYVVVTSLSTQIHCSFKYLAVFQLLYLVHARVKVVK